LIVFWILLAFGITCWIASLLTVRFWMPKVCDPRHMYTQSLVIVIGSPLVVLWLLWEGLVNALTSGDEACEAMREAHHNQEPPKEVKKPELFEEIGEPPF
jgi:hypothetical protein